METFKVPSLEGTARDAEPSLVKTKQKLKRTNESTIKYGNPKRAKTYEDGDVHLALVKPQHWLLPLRTANQVFSESKASQHLRHTVALEEHMEYTDIGRSRINDRIWEDDEDDDNDDKESGIDSYNSINGDKSSIVNSDYINTVQTKSIRSDIELSSRETNALQTNIGYRGSDIEKNIADQIKVKYKRTKIESNGEKNTLDIKEDKYKLINFDYNDDNIEKNTLDKIEIEYKLANIGSNYDIGKCIDKTEIGDKKVNKLYKLDNMESDKSDIEKSTDCTNDADENECKSQLDDMVFVEDVVEKSPPFYWPSTIEDIRGYDIDVFLVEDDDDDLVDDDDDVENNPLDVYDDMVFLEDIVEKSAGYIQTIESY